MPAVGETLRVEGLAGLQRAFKLADATTRRELPAGLRKVAEPVRADAERLALDGISRIGVPWSQMRIGVTLHSVYVAPRQRGARGRGGRRRPNLAGLLLDRSMIPALQKNEERVDQGMETLLADIGRAWETA